MKKWTWRVSAIFAYQVKNINQFRLLTVLSLFWKDSFLETIYSVISSSNSWILDSMLMHLIRWFFLFKNFWIFVYGNFSIYFMNVIVSNHGLPVWSLEKILEPGKRKTNLGLPIRNLEKVLEPGKRKTNLELAIWNLEKMLEPGKRKTNLGLPVGNLEKILEPVKRETNLGLPIWNLGEC